MVSVDLDQPCVLACGTGGGDISGAFLERDPVVGPSVDAAHGRRDGYLGEGIGYRVAIRDIGGTAAHEFERRAVSDQLAGRGAEIEDSGQAEDTGDLDYLPGTGRA